MKGGHTGTDGVGKLMVQSFANYLEIWIIDLVAIGWNLITAPGEYELVSFMVSVKLHGEA